MKDIEITQKLGFDKEYNKIYTLILRVDGLEQSREHFKNLEEFEQRKAELEKIQNDFVNEQKKLSSSNDKN